MSTLESMFPNAAMRKLLRYPLLIVATLLFTAPRLPAPITVPPEAAPNLSAPAEDRPKPKAATKNKSKKTPAASKAPAEKKAPAPAPGQAHSFAGTWKGKVLKRIGTNVQNPSLTIQVAADEKTLKLGTDPTAYACERKGDTLSFFVSMRPAGDITWEGTMTLTLKPGGSVILIGSLDCVTPGIPVAALTPFYWAGTFTH